MDGVADFKYVCCCIIMMVTISKVWMTTAIVPDNMSHPVAAKCKPQSKSVRELNCYIASCFQSLEEDDHYYLYPTTNVHSGAAVSQHIMHASATTASRNCSTCGLMTQHGDKQSIEGKNLEVGLDLDGCQIRHVFQRFQAFLCDTAAALKLQHPQVCQWKEALQRFVCDSV